MSLFYLDLAKIDHVVLQNLIDLQVRENDTIEYKQELPGNGEDARREFRFDVSSFSNANGGDIVFGIKERREDNTPTGEPEAFVPLQVIPGEVELRLHQILATQIEPRIPGVRIHSVKVDDGYIVVVRIPRSWNSLHLVQFNDSFRIYRRVSNCKVIMKPSEIRAGFVATESGFERMRSFRSERIRKIEIGDAPIDVQYGPKFVMHLIPFSSLDRTIEWPLDQVKEYKNLIPMKGYVGCRERYTFDGFVRSIHDSSEKTWSFLQVFRDGTIEASTNMFFSVDRKCLWLSSMEEEVINFTRMCLQFLNKLGVVAPLSLGISLLNVGSYEVPYNRPKYFAHEVFRIRENELIVPEVIFEAIDSGIDQILRPAFDRIWNAIGFDGSWHYDENGIWKNVR